MEQYILPLFTLLLNFTAVAACIRFLLSRQGLYWIIPLLLSVLLLFDSGSVLYGASYTFRFTAPALIRALIAILWYVIITVFHYGLKQSAQKENYRLQVRKSENEAAYLMKLQRRTWIRESRQSSLSRLYSARKVERNLYPVNWIDLYE